MLLLVRGALEFARRRVRGARPPWQGTGSPRRDNPSVAARLLEMITSVAGVADAALIADQIRVLG